MAKISTGMITGTILAVVMAVVFFSMMTTLIPTATIAVHNLSDAMGGRTNTSSSQYIVARETLGTGAAALGGNLDIWTGYFWVLGPLVLVIAIIMGIFLKGRK